MSRLILEVGQGQIEVEFKGTATQIRAVVRRFAETVGIDVEGVSDAEVGKAVLRWFARTVREGSMAKQRSEAYADLAASIESQLLSDNDIYDDE